jgi:signal peptidase I
MQAVAEGFMVLRDWSWGGYCMSGLVVLWLLISGLVAANPDSLPAQRALKVSLGYDHGWAWEEGGLISIRSVPSMSMAPSLLTGDRVLTLKRSRAPRMGDIWTFDHPHSDRVMVKRIVGMSGDSVQVKHGMLIINGREVGRRFIRSLAYVDDGQVISAQEYAEQLPGEKRAHLIHEFSDSDSLDETPVFKVPAGHVFMIGDNRDNSEDSRAPSGHRALAARSPELWPYRTARLPSDPRDDAIGFVPIENLIGLATTIVYSLHTCEGKGRADIMCLTPNVDRRL